MWTTNTGKHCNISSQPPSANKHLLTSHTLRHLWQNKEPTTSSERNSCSKRNNISRHVWALKLARLLKLIINDASASFVPRSRWIPEHRWQPFDFISLANSRNWVGEIRNYLRRHKNQVWNASDLKSKKLLMGTNWQPNWRLCLMKAASVLCRASGSISVCFVVSYQIKPRRSLPPRRLVRGRSYNTTIRLTQIFRSLTFTGQLAHSHQRVKITFRCKRHTCKIEERNKMCQQSIAVILEWPKAHEDETLSCVRWCQYSWVMSSKKSGWVRRTTGSTIGLTGNTFRFSLLWLWKFSLFLTRPAQLSPSTVSQSHASLLF